MSKSLSSMSKSEKSQAIDRRIRQQKGGLGYWAAVDAKNKIQGFGASEIKGRNHKAKW